ncbi:DUF2127 domain-containing protein [Actinomycetospora endophytica]|uniref:DUF2127 domain-containing protein n=1 Tax=Actinomycetospora endophytica TaxID=2291215 RepID=A0ABS8P3A6_9PSEU|nr:DUF2127 domain-containing protein [Actinomycetospora endophytica]MCD2192736.1 DUF2127 domain-containing protein [Actinomycetospora endophytica]
MPSQEPADGFVRPPGTDPARRHRQLTFELVGCAWNGHALVGTDAATVSEEDALVVRELDGERRLHRCLRCDAWMMLPTPADPARERPAPRDEIHLPTRGRPLKSRYVLRMIALTRVFNVLVLLLVLGGAIAVLVNQATLRDDLVANASAFQEILGGQVVGQLQGVLSGGAGPLWLIAAGLLALVVLEAAEGIGLWRTTRWGEYLSFVLTTLLLVPEALELTSSSSPGTIIGMAVNIAVVLYLLLSKRLFGLRGGVAAIAAEREHDISWAALRRHLPETPATPVRA